MFNFILCDARERHGIFGRSEPTLGICDFSDEHNSDRSEEVLLACRRYYVAMSSLASSQPLIATFQIPVGSIM